MAGGGGTVVRRRGGGPGGGGSGRARRPRRRGSGAPPASPVARTGSGRPSPPPAGRRRRARAGSTTGGRARGGDRSTRRRPWRGRAVRLGGSRATRSVSARRARAARRRRRSATRAAVVPGSGRGGRSMTSRSTERPASSAPAIERPSSSVSGVRTTSQSRRTPRATASTGSRARARSSQATIAPSAWASAARRRASVVLPELASPRRATLALRGRPPGPRIASSAGKPGPDDPLDGSAGGSRLFLLRQRRGRQRSDDPRSCRAPACLEGRQSSRHVRGERRHRATIEHLF